MPAIEVLSPFNGRPVRIREQDIGKAVRDQDNKIFYVLPRPDGSGYYSAPSKAGGARDIERYDKYLERMGAAKNVAQKREQVHIRMEKKKASIGKIIKFIIFIAIILGLWYAYANNLIPGIGGE